MAGTMPTTLEDLLLGTRVEGHEKNASSQSRPTGQQETDYATELAMLEKFAQENFTQEDMLKIAASSKISGDILADVQIEKLASAMPILIKIAMEHVLPIILPGILKAALNKIAVGESDVRSGNRPSDTVEDDPSSQTPKEDDHDNQAGTAKVDSLTNANQTEGASGSGGRNPASHQGEPVTNTHGSTVGKMAALNQDQLRRLIAGKLPANIGGNITSYEAEKSAMGDMMPGGGEMGGGGEMDPGAILQQLLAKQAAGQPLSPQEQEILQQLMGGMGGMGGGMPPGAEGGMVREASAQSMTTAQKQYLFENLLRQRLG